ncbi:STAS domain [Trinorchestia longiramus]|nr:STAS domain [Trinorchestia longiramus]
MERRVPILRWAKEYSLRNTLRDAIAGLSVGLLTVPQALAYSIVAGLPPNYGLYSAFVGSYVYVLFGSTPGLRIGPTAVMAILVEHYTRRGGPDYAVIMCLTSGVAELLAAVFNAGFLVNFISRPVISGFCSAAALTVISSQTKTLLGLKVKTDGIMDTWIKIVTNITKSNWHDFGLGITCIVFLVMLKNLKQLLQRCSSLCILQATEQQTHTSRGDRVLSLLSLSRNAVVVMLAAVFVYSTGGSDFALTGHVESGVPSFQLPTFTARVGNLSVSFMEVVSDVGLGVVVIPFIAIVDDVAIIGATYPGLHVDTNQEIAVLGLINILGSFFRSMPITASLSRTAVVCSSGGVTPASGLVDGSMVLAALAFLTPAFWWIPRASLAAVIICAVAHMVDVRVVLTLWRTHKVDMAVLLITFLTCLLWAIEWGVLVGTLLHLLVVLFVLARPAVHVTSKSSNCGEERIVVTPRHGVMYPSVNHIRNKVKKVMKKLKDRSLPVVLDCSYITTIDSTAAAGLAELSEEFHNQGYKLEFSQLRPALQHAVLAVARQKAVLLHVITGDGLSSAVMGPGDVVIDRSSLMATTNVDATRSPASLAPRKPSFDDDTQNDVTKPFLEVAPKPQALKANSEESSDDENSENFHHS